MAREADTVLYDSLRAGEYCYVLNSRQMGKSSLRVQAVNRLQKEGITCAVIDLLSIGIRELTAEQWYNGIIRRLGLAVGMKTLEVLTWLRDREDVTPVQKLTEFVETVLLDRISGDLIVFIDEIDSVLDLKFSAVDFFGAIRAFYDRRAFDARFRHLTFVFLGVATAYDLTRDREIKSFDSDTHARPFDIGQAIDLRGLPFRGEASLFKVNVVDGKTAALRWECYGDRVAMKPDGSRFVVTAPFTGTLNLYDSAGVHLKEWKVDGPIYDLQFSATGDRIITQSEREIQLWDLDGKSYARLVSN